MANRDSGPPKKAHMSWQPGKSNDDSDHDDKTARRGSGKKPARGGAKNVTIKRGLYTRESGPSQKPESTKVDNTCPNPLSDHELLASYFCRGPLPRPPPPREPSVSPEGSIPSFYIPITLRTPKKRAPSPVMNTEQEADVDEFNQMQEDEDEIEESEIERKKGEEADDEDMEPVDEEAPEQSRSPRKRRQAAITAATNMAPGSSEKKVKKPRKERKKKNHDDDDDDDMPKRPRKEVSERKRIRQERNAALKDDDKIYCYCEKVFEQSTGEMVACDDSDCSIEWYHFGCLGLTTPPKGKWYCPECRSAKFGPSKKKHYAPKKPKE